MFNFKNLLVRKSLLEYSTEIAIILASLGLLGFFKLTEEVIEGETLGFDHRVLLWFRNPADLSDPIGPAWLEVVMRDITALGGLLVLGLLTVAACGYLWLSQRHKLAIFVALSIPAGSLLNGLLKGFFERPRPDIVPHATDAALSSFPSGHAMMSTIVFLTLGGCTWVSTGQPTSSPAGLPEQSGLCYACCWVTGFCVGKFEDPGLMSYVLCLMSYVLCLQTETKKLNYKVFDLRHKT
jgi:membrane-associated phospholipid phosphatase